MNKFHKQIFTSIQETAKISEGSTQDESYHGTKSTFYNLKAAEKVKIAKEFKKKNKEISHEEFIKLLNSLNKGGSYEEKTIVGTLIGLYTNHRRQLNPKLYDKWLNNLHGWAEVDAYCQSAMSSEEMDRKWEKWKKLLLDFSKSRSLSKKRASLVFLTRPVRESSEIKFSTFAFENIDRLKSEIDILITKSISWILREMVKNHKQLVKDYLEKNKDTLPKIAVRETGRKLQTGRK